jgi:GNAT superfamily N-acetyltransferase
MSINPLSISIHAKYFEVELCTQDCDLEKVAAVVNAAYKKNDFLAKDRTSVNELKTILLNPLKKLYIAISPENKICGTALITLNPSSEEADFGLFSVHPDEQGKNLGSLLLNHVEEEAFLRFHMKTVSLSTAPQKLVQYYQSQGYQIIGNIPFPDENSLKNDCKRITCTLLQKKLPPSSL